MNNHSYAVISVENGHECVIDLHTSKYMTDAIYHDVEAKYKNGFVLHRIDGMYDVFDSDCKIIVDKLDWQDAYSSNLIKVRKNDMINVINMATVRLLCRSGFHQECSFISLLHMIQTVHSNIKSLAFTLIDKNTMILVILLQLNKFTSTLMVKCK